MMVKTKDVYDLIGKQDITFICDNYEFRENFDQIIERNKGKSQFDTALDAFVYGVICGKRMDRQRRKDGIAR